MRFHLGEFVVDVDSYFRSRPHRHIKDPVWNICHGCLEISRDLALQICDRILENHSDIQIVFSGRRGFHIHVLDFDYKDWSRPSAENPLKAMVAGRYKYALTILPDYSWDRSHFILSCDPMRVVTVPETLNIDTGLVCSNIGARADSTTLQES